MYYKYNVKKYFQLLVEGKRDDDWGAYFANLKKTITPYIKHGHQARSLRVESWQEYDAKVGETNTSLFEPGNSKFNMKAFLKKLRKKNRVGVNLPGEN